MSAAICDWTSGLAMDVLDQNVLRDGDETRAGGIRHPGQIVRDRESVLNVLQIVRLDTGERPGVKTDEYRQENSRAP